MYKYIMLLVDYKIKFVKFNTINVHYCKRISIIIMFLLQIMVQHIYLRIFSNPYLLFTKIDFFIVSYILHAMWILCATKRF